MKRIILLLYLCACSSCMFAQLEDHLSYAEGGYYEFIKDSEISPEGFFEKFAPELGLGKEDEMRIFRQNEDDLGNLHIMYLRFYKGIKVEGNTFALHTKDGIVFSANGKLTDKLSVSTLPKLSEQEARDLAIRSVNSELFAWESAEWEESLRMEEGREASYFPQGELLILKEEAANRYRLAWKFGITSISPFEDWFIFIDAGMGKVLGKRTRINQCNPSSGTTNTLYNGIQVFQIKDNAWSNNYSLDDCERDIHTKIFAAPAIPINPRYGGVTPEWWFLTSKVKNRYANWGNANQVEASAHWIAQRAWDYLDQKFNWQGLDGNGRRIRILTRTTDWQSGQLVPNNFYANARELVMIGALPDGNGGVNHMATFHHVAHEIFHGVVINTSDLTPSRESGSVHEAYCDFFGAAVENYALGSVNWSLCSDAANTANGIRDLNDPNAFENPAIVGDEFYVPQNCNNAESSNDFCFKHLNASIPGRAFNLIAGSSNPSQNGVSLTGIGLDKAMDIAFRALRDGYLTQDAGFIETRNAWVMVAEMIYGRCSEEAYTVATAWGAVGVGNKYNLCTEIIGSSKLMECNTSSSLGHFRLQSPNHARIQWNIPASWSFRIGGSRGEELTLLSIPFGSRGGTFGATITYQGRMASDYHNFQLVPCLQMQRISSDQQILAKKIYPNPANKFLLIEAEENSIGANFRIVNLQGKEVKTGFMNSGINKISTDHLTSGFYFIESYTERTKEVHKIQIAH